MFVDYLCSISDSKLVYDCAFELNLGSPSLTAFLSLQEDRMLLGQPIQVDV